MGGYMKRLESQAGKKGDKHKSIIPKITYLISPQDMSLKGGPFPNAAYQGFKSFKEMTDWLKESSLQDRKDRYAERLRRGELSLKSTSPSWLNRIKLEAQKFPSTLKSTPNVFDQEMERLKAQMEKIKEQRRLVLQDLVDRAWSGMESDFKKLQAADNANYDLYASLMESEMDYKGRTQGFLSFTLRVINALKWKFKVYNPFDSSDYGRNVIVPYRLQQKYNEVSADWLKFSGTPLVSTRWEDSQKNIYTKYSPYYPNLYYPDEWVAKFPNG